MDAIHDIHNMHNMVLAKRSTQCKQNLSLHRSFVYIVCVKMLLIHVS